MIKADFQDIERAAQRWADRARRLPVVTLDTAEELARAAVPDAQEETPSDTGRLDAGWAVTRGNDRVNLENPVRYAGFVLDGQLANRVRARVRDRIPRIQPDIVRRLQE